MKHLLMIISALLLGGCLEVSNTPPSQAAAASEASYSTTAAVDLTEVLAMVAELRSRLRKVEATATTALDNNAEVNNFYSSVSTTTYVTETTVVDYSHSLTAFADVTSDFLDDLTGGVAMTSIAKDGSYGTQQFVVVSESGQWVLYDGDGSTSPDASQDVDSFDFRILQNRNQLYLVLDVYDAVGDWAYHYSSVMISSPDGDILSDPDAADPFKVEAGCCLAFQALNWFDNYYNSIGFTNP